MTGITVPIVLSKGTETEIGAEANLRVAEPVFATETDELVIGKGSGIDPVRFANKWAYPLICTTPNQRMAPNSAGDGVQDFNHLHVTLAVSNVAAFSYGHSTTNWPSTIGQEFGEALGIYYFNEQFNVLNIRWTTTGSAPRLFQNYNVPGHSGTFTQAAYIKVISGTLGGVFELRKSYDDGWGLWGGYNMRNRPFFGAHEGLQFASAAGEMNIALYGRVAGIADLEGGRWELFPSIA